MNILIVDDSPTNLKLLRAILEAEGLTIFDAADGVEALLVLEREKIDAVISDILMPRMDGYRLCYEVRKLERLKNLPFISYTATYVSPGDEKLTLDLGADMFIRKPASAQVMVDALREVMIAARYRQPRSIPMPREVEVLKEYSERLVGKLEERNTELMAQAEAVRKSEARLRAIIQTEPECVQVVSREGWLLEMNLAGLVMLQAGSLEDVQKQPLLQFIAPEYRVAFAGLHQQVMSGADGTLEFEVIGLKGARRWLETHATPLRDSSGQVEALLGLTRDITAQKETARELARAHEFSVGTIDALSAQLCVLDNSGIIIAVNRAWCDFYEHNRLPGQPAQDFIGADYFSACRSANGDSGVQAQQLSDGIHQMLRGERSEFSLEYPCHSPAEQRWFLARVTRFRGDDGNHVVVVHENITERKLAEARVRDNEARLAGILDSATDAIVSVDDQQNVIVFNKAAESTFGHRAADMLGQPLERLLPTRLRENHRRLVGAFGASGQAAREMGAGRELLALHANGEEFPIEASSIASITVAGSKLFTVILRDVTERKQARQLLRQNEDRTRRILHAAAVGLWEWDLLTGEVYFSPEWKQQLGYADDEISANFDEWQKRVHPDDLGRALAAVGDFRDGRAPSYAVEVRLLHRDGSWRWIYGEAELERNENGEPVTMRGSQIDITERVHNAQLQAALFNISVASHESSDLDDLYRRVHVIVSGLMSARNFYIALLDEANDQIRFDYWVDEIEASSTPLRFSDGTGLTGRVLRSGQPLLVYPQSSHEQALLEGLTIIGPQGVDWLGVPLKVLDKTIGVLAVQNYTGEAHYEQRHLELLQFVSDQIAAAVNRKRIEQQQRDSDQRFRDLVDSTDGIVWQADASTFVFDYVSNNAERLLGYPLADWLQPGFWADHIHPEDRTHAVQFCAACTGRFEDHEFEYRFITHSGSEVWLRDIVKVVVEDGKPRWLRGLMLDITSIKLTQQSLEQAASALVQSQHLLEASQCAAHVGGWELDVASGKLFWTNETYRIHDLSLDEHTPGVQTAINFYVPESQQIVSAAVQLAIDEGTPFDLELELISAQGRHLWVRSTGSATRVAGRTIKIGGAIQDITERKRAEQWQQQYSRVLAMISAEASLPFVLEELARFVEKQSRGSSCSMLLLSNDGMRLTLGAAPSLPDYFIQALDGIPIGEQGGACGTAALEGTSVLVDDFHATDGSDYWLELANRAGLRSCWSSPIFSSERKVMGTLAIYHGEPWSPTPDDKELLSRAASLAALAIDRARHQDAQRLAKTVFEENIEGVMVTSPDDRILMVNPAFERLTGYSPAEVVGQAPTLLDSGRHDEAFWSEIRARLAQAGRWEGEVWSRRKNGEVYLSQMSIADVHNAAGATSQRISIIKDMSVQMVQAARIEQLAFYDALTGLPNRALFLDRLENIMASAERQGNRGAILFMDLDRFKEINDSKGHAIGDLALAEVARRFLTACRREETLARLGGDEFVLIVEGADHQSAALVAGRLLRSLSEPLILMGAAHSIGTSIGIAIYPDDGTTTEELIKHADIAMFRAKASGGGYRFYQADMSAEFEKHLEIAQRLSAAMDADQLQLYYQPKIELATGKLTGAEALLRWHDADLGWISPAEFIPIAEQRGMMGKLGDWVLRKACLQLTEWRNRRIALPGRLSVNVSARQLEDPEIVGRMLEIVHEAGGTPAWLELELTESSMMSDPEQSIQILEYFAAAGFGLSIDDFGTGYSSLAYLKRFAADEIKIDISFVRNMLTDADDYAIVSTIIAMAHGLGMTTAAEGVELEGQAEALKALRCDVAQGYLYSRPEAPDIFAGKWLGSDRN